MIGRRREGEGARMGAPEGVAIKLAAPMPKGQRISTRRPWPPVVLLLGEFVTAFFFRFNDQLLIRQFAHGGIDGSHGDAGV